MLTNKDKKILEQRKKIERQVTQYVLKCNASVYNLQRGYNDRILSLSPGAANYNTSVGYFGNSVYAGLSQSINENNGERSTIEKKIESILPIRGGYAFKVFNDWDDMDYDDIRIYCNHYNIPMITKEKFSQVKKLVKKWRLASPKEHYQMTKQEKRKLKKLHNRSK